MSSAVQYVIDEHGAKTAVLLSLVDYEKLIGDNERLLEDLADLAAIAERRNEPSIPHDQFKMYIDSSFSS